MLINQMTLIKIKGILIKKKGDYQYVKWKGYNNLFNSWMNKKDIV